MKIEHIALASKSEQDADKFFIGLLGLKKARTFSVSADLSAKFFGVNREIDVVHYTNENIDFEIIIVNENSKGKEIYTHPCLLVKNREEILEKAISMGFAAIKVPRKDSEGFYLFIKDSWGNLYEIK